MKMVSKNSDSLIGWIFCLVFLVISNGAFNETFMPVDALGKNPPSLSEPFSTNAEYDSGWTIISKGQSLTLTHNLGGDADDYVVYMEFYNQTYGNQINQMFYGGGDLGTKSSSGAVNNERRGVYWKNLTDASITVYRTPEDRYVEKVRIRIWKYDSPNWDSGWLNLTAGAAATTLNHNLGWPSDNYVVYMDYKNTTQGTNQCYHSGNDFGNLTEGVTHDNERVGVYWRTLTTNSITLFRRAEDTFAASVRIRIWIRPTATYDSGWVTINQDEQKILTHNVSGNPDDYIVDLQFKSAGNGVNQRCYGGFDVGSNPSAGLVENDRVGAYWMVLNSSNITVYRRAEDIYAPEVRVRIFHIWPPRAPDYDSWWVDMNAPQTKTLTHNLGGIPESYYVDLIFKNSGGVSHQFYGGVDLGTKTYGESYNNHRFGAYWYGLTNTSITLFRRAEDTQAPKLRVRIWKMPKPAYDSGWVDMTAGAAKTTLNHYVKGSFLSYLVDMKYKTGGVIGINHFMYGGNDYGNQPPTGMSENDRVGAYWQQLNGTSISLYRRPEDVYAPQIRIMIWRTSVPDYQTSLLSVSNGSHTHNHNVGGNPGQYLVNMTQYDPDTYVLHTNSYGGMDLGANSAGGGPLENDRVGAYWYDLNPSSIKVFRRSEDTVVDYMRLRIWKPKSSITLDDIRRHLLGITLLTAPKIYEADFNDDGRIDIADMVYFILMEP